MMNDFENQLDAIRIALYEESKDMRSDAIADATNENAKKIAEQFGIVIVKGESGFDTPGTIT